MSGLLGRPTLRVAQVSLTSLFFVWGFVTALNDILLPHLRQVFTLTYAEAALVQFSFFLAYFCCSVPSAWSSVGSGTTGGSSSGCW